MTHFHDHEADMSGPHWQRVATRRRVGDTVTRDYHRHAQHWRACNEERFEGDPLAAARGIVRAMAICVPIWALLAVFVWAFLMMSE